MDQQLAEVFPAGEYLADELEARGWTQSDFASILGRPTQFVSEIINGKKEITRESAAQIGSALGTSAELWLNLQNTYLLRRQSEDPRARGDLDRIERRARLNTLVPLNALRKRGWITTGSDEETETQVLDLLGMARLDEEPRFQIAARRSNDGDPLTPVQIAWLAQARRVAGSVTVRPFDRLRLEGLAPSIARHVADPAGFADLPALLSDVGVRLVYVEALPGSKLKGASFVVDDDSPVLALSGHGKRLDKVLFTLMHEIAHVIRGDVGTAGLLIDDDHHTLGDETATDDLAGRWVIPSWESEVPTPVTRSWVERQALRLGVHPIVVVGRLQRDHRLPWHSSLARGAPTVIEYLAGWHKHAGRAGAVSSR